LKPLNVLAWDTATDRAAAALIRWRHGAVEILADHAGDSGLHSQLLPPLAARMLGDNGLAPNQVDLVVVGRGPGSFTGLRTGLALAKGLAWGAGRPVLGLGTLDVLAAQILADEPDPEALAAPVIDARHGEVFVSLHGREGLVRPPSALPPLALPAALGATAQGRPIRVDGPAWPLVRDALAGAELMAGTGEGRRVSAVVLAGLGAEVFQKEPEAWLVHPPLPLYIRSPDLRPGPVPGPPAGGPRGCASLAGRNRRVSGE
jgi:tRNA threonylcarbamoyladenosine biosynthesis protein TsaB